MKNLSIIFLTLILSGFVNGNISFSVDRTGETVPKNGIAEITIAAEWLQGSNSYIIYPPVMTQLIGLKITDYITFGQSLTVNSQIVQRVIHLFKFSVTNNVGMMAETGPIFIDYRLSGSKEKIHRQLSGISFKVVRFSRSFLMMLIPLILVLLLIPIVSTIIIIKASRKKKNLLILDKSSVEDSIMKELEQVKKYKIDGDTKRYFRELDDLIKKYFRKKYQIGSILDLDSKSIGKSGPDKHTLFSACELLRLSHNVCYAGYQPSNQEQDRIYNFLKRTLVKNRPHKAGLDEEMYLKDG